MIKVYKAKPEEVYPNIKDMTERHFEELSVIQDKVSLDVDLSFYEAMSKANRLECFSVKDGDEWVGYVVFFTLPNHYRYKTKSIAMNDVLYLKPEYRKGRDGINVIKEVNKYLKERYDMIVWHVKDKNDFSPILIREGFVKQDTSYSFVRD